MNDRGQIIKTILQAKAGYKLVRNKHRCIEVTMRLELADGIPTEGTLGSVMDAIRQVRTRTLDAVAGEFLP